MLTNSGQFAVSFNDVVGTIDEGQVTAIVEQTLVPVKQEVEAKADAVDENPLPLDALPSNTYFALDRQYPNRICYCGVNTTFTVGPPSNGTGFKQDDRLKLIVIHTADNLNIGVAGIPDDNYTTAPASQKAKDSVWLFVMSYEFGYQTWEFKRLNIGGMQVAKRFFVKGVTPNSHISIPSHTETTPKTPLANQDNGPITIVFIFRANPLEKTGNIEILFSKGAGSTSTVQMTIGTNGILRIGVGPGEEDRISTQDSVMDNEIHIAALTFSPGTGNTSAQGTLNAYVDGVLLATRTDVDNPVYNQAPYNIFSLETGTQRYGTNAKSYGMYVWKSIKTQAEILGIEQGKIPSGYVTGHPWNGNANDIGPNAIHGIVTDNPVFSSENV